MIDFARRSGAYLPYSPNTAYLNTISPGRQPEYPGDRSLERRIEAYIRWNAMAMVVRANRESTEYGGHLASYASSATMYEVGFNPLLAWRHRRASRRHGVHPGAFVARHLCARLPRGALDRGAVVSLPPGSRRRRPVLVSASLADAGLLAVPHRVHGAGPHHGHLPGPLHALHGAPGHDPERRSQGLGVPRRRRDGRTRGDGCDHDAGARRAG